MRKHHKKAPLEKVPIMKPRREKGAYSTAGSLQKENSPSLSNIPKSSLHFILHYLTLQLIKKGKQPSSSSSFSQQRHHFFLFQYYKNFQLKGRLKG